VSRKHQRTVREQNEKCHALRQYQRLHNEDTFPMIDPMNRNKPDGILEAVGKGGTIQMETLVELLALLKAKTEYHFHVAVEVRTNALLKTIDNEDDAMETIRRLRAKK